MSAAPHPIRAMFALLAAMLLALRLLSPAGFMPAFDHGAITIVACPDFAPKASPAHHHGGPKPQKPHQPCPFAAAAAAATFDVRGAAVAAAIVFAATLLLGRTFLFLERDRSGERPPTRGPPIPA